MIPEKTHLYKQARQQKASDELSARHKKSVTASTSSSNKRSRHKHIYQKIILHYGSSSFCWGRRCEICGRVDSTYKATNERPQDFTVTGKGTGGSWSEICLCEIHEKYPEYIIMTLEHAEWKEWTDSKTGQ